MIYKLPKPAHRGPLGTGAYFDSFTAEQIQAAYEAGQKSQVRISVPTDGMEQEFQNHHRIGYKAGQRSAFERCVKICDLAARSIEAARAHADGSLGGANPQYFHPILKTISDITNKIRAEIDSQT